jgi:hypothetical protein
VEIANASPEQRDGTKAECRISEGGVQVVEDIDNEGP